MLYVLQTRSGYIVLGGEATLGNYWMRQFMKFQALLLANLVYTASRFSTPGVGVQLESGAAPDTTSRDVAPSAAPADVRLHIL